VNCKIFIFKFKKTVEITILSTRLFWLLLPLISIAILLFYLRADEYPAAQNGNPYSHLLRNYRGAADLDNSGLKRERLFNIPAPSVISWILRIIGGQLDQIAESAVRHLSYCLRANMGLDLQTNSMLIIYDIFPQLRCILLSWHHCILPSGSPIG